MRIAAEPEYVVRLQCFISGLRKRDTDISSEELRDILPEKIQEEIATHTVTKMLQKANGDVAAVALAWLMEEPLGKLDESKAQRLGRITRAAGRSDKDVEDEGRDAATQSESAVKLAKDACSVANQMDTSRYCYRGVKRALAKSRVTLEGMSAYMAKDQLDRDDRFEKVLVTNNLVSAKLERGDVIVHPQNYLPGESKPDGHIAIYLGDGKEASDHVQQLIGGKATVYRMRKV